MPLYVQVREELARQIRDGQYQPRQLLPTEQELVQRFGVSRITVRRALSDLVQDGLIYRQIGRGTFVAANPIVETLTELVGHLEELQRQQLQPEVTLLQQAVLPAEPEPAAALGHAQPCLFVRRLISVEALPLLLLDVWLPLRLGVAWEPPLLTQVPIHGVLEAHGLPPYAAEQRVAARLALAEEAELLAVPAGAPLLEVTRSESTAAGQGLLWSRALYRGDRYAYIIRLHRRRSKGP